ncbi:hypothetical protein MKW92_043067 [Papaver armeniacum]|nr:hypothetical protein MKW92_043067 [Papaver armeniacum]
MASDKSINIPNLDQEENLTAGTLETNGDPLFSVGSTSGNQSTIELSDDLEECFRSVEEEVMKWESSRTKIWDSGVVAVAEYLQAINEAQRLSENLIKLHEGGEKKDDELLHQVQIVSRIAMVKLEEEFTHILVRGSRPFEPERMSFHSNDVGTLDGISISSFEFDHITVDESPSRYSSTSTYSGELVIDLVHQYAIPDLNRIVNAMFNNHFEQECCEAYVNVRKDALAECLFMLEVDNLSIDGGVGATTDQGHIFAIKIKKWNRAMKNFTSVYLASEKLLCDRVFGEFRSASSTCFAKIFEVPMLQLLKCGEAIMDIQGRQPERLFSKLDMYEVLRDIDNMFLEEQGGSSVRFVVREMLKRSGDCVRGTVLEFEQTVRSNISINPFYGGGIHHLSKYVMKFIVVLAGDHSDTLNMVLEVSHGGEFLEEKENEDGLSSNVHPLAYHLKLVASSLKSNLDVKSLLYTDDALRYIFLMNNIFYMVSKVKKNSNLKQFFGDYWIGQHVAEYQEYAMNYERTTWSPVLNLLTQEGMFVPGSHSVSKRVIKKRLKDFNLSFEEVYKNQTAWLIPDDRLREELQISVSTKVFQAYSTFLGRYDVTSTAKFFKYTAMGCRHSFLIFLVGLQNYCPTLPGHEVSSHHFQKLFSTCKTFVILAYRVLRFT